MKFNINKSLSIQHKKLCITGTIIGIDKYSLQNFHNRKLKWNSLTLISSNKSPYDRYWITKWEDEWILWLKAPLEDGLCKNLILDRSGLASIDIIGDAGLSTPTAALAVFKWKSIYYATERFAGSRTMAFWGNIIPSPKR